MTTILNGIPLGIQSYCFRSITDNKEVAKAVKACGLSAIELCRKHVNHEDPADVERTLDLYQSEGITVTSYGINGFPNDEKKVRPYFEFARKAGFKTLGAHPEPDTYELLERLCGEYGVRLALHNHGRRHRWCNSVHIGDALKKTGDWLGLCIDTAWLLDSKEDPVKFIEKFAPRVYAIHFKDFTFNRDGSHNEAILGQGNLNLPALHEALQKVNLSGFATIEYEGNVDDPIPSTKNCVEEFLKVFQVKDLAAS